MTGARSWRTLERLACARHACRVLLLTPVVMVAACTDETGIIPPEPLRAVGSGSEALVITTTEDTEECAQPPGECSLRGALLAANSNPEGGPYTIVLAADETYRIEDDGRPGLPVRADVVIEGNGAAINGTAAGAVIIVDADGTPVQLTLENVTVSRGLSGIIVRDATLTLSHSTVSKNGYLFALGGGISASRSSIVLTNSTVEENEAERGGGIFSTGSDVTLRHSAVTGNFVSSEDDRGLGGGIFSGTNSTLRLINSSVSQNVANAGGEGGGIYSVSSDVTLAESLVRDNSAPGGFTGGISSLRESAGGVGSLTLIRSTVSDNTSFGGGGGIWVRNRAFIANSTLSRNSVDDRLGAALLIGAVGSPALVTLINSTVAQNIGSDGGAALRAFMGELTLNNTIVAHQQSGADCVAGQSGTVTSLGHNLDSDGSCGVDAPGDRPNADAKLGPLTHNGGPTPTHELHVGSDALDAGDDAVCTAEPVNGVDQRGIERPQARSCDVGAFEREFEPYATNLTAEPALLEIEGGLLGLRLRLLDLSARLVRADTRAPVEGETATMTVSGRGGSQEICSAVTDADGAATCSGDLSSLLGLVLGGYTASFAGTWQYEASSASAPLIRVGGGH